MSIYWNHILNKVFNSSDELSVSIFDLTGKIIYNFKEEAHFGVWIKTLDEDVLGLKRGVYVVKISSLVNGNTSSKILVH